MASVGIVTIKDHTMEKLNSRKGLFHSPGLKNPRLRYEWVGNNLKHLSLNSGVSFLVVSSPDPSVHPHTWYHMLYSHFLLLLKNCVCVCTICVEVQYPLWPAENRRASRAGVSGSCEPPSMGAQNRTPVLCRSSQSSSLQQHLSSPCT